jgi:Na+/proline symporter
VSAIDLAVLVTTLVGIAAYGAWKTRGSRDLEGYLRGDNRMRWGTIGLSVLATQASAITFLSTPGLGYERGLPFVQNYLGQPIALVLVSALFIPIYYRLGVYTAYEYLERRFDLKTRQLGAVLFLVQRGLAAGITIYAPAIIISTILRWNLDLTIVLSGLIVVTYTVAGGAKAVSLTQKRQLAVILIGMGAAFVIIAVAVSRQIPFGQALAVAGKMGKLQAISFSLDPKQRYTIWTGLFGGTFLALSYFGTDQSQVGRYLTGRSIGESRLGLMFNAVMKVPMQFFILLTGVMVFLFYQFVPPPLLFKEAALETVLRSPRAAEMRALEDRHAAVFAEKRDAVRALAAAEGGGDPAAIGAASARLSHLQDEAEGVRDEAKTLIREVDPRMETKDTDYVFLTFVLGHLPKGLIGLLIAVIFCAAMSASSSELNALGSTSTVDLYKRLWRPAESERHYVTVSKWMTALWGAVAISFALMAYLAENLIEAVNILGSLFYGTILGIFLTAFLLKRVRGHAVFAAAVCAETTVLALYLTTTIGYLWYNLIGCGLVLLLGLLFQALPVNIAPLENGGRP